MASIVDRMVRAAKLDPDLFAEVNRDETSLNQALTVVALSAAAAGISGLLLGPLGLIINALATLFTWAVWAFVVHFVGTGPLAEPGTRATLGQVLRVTGFAAAPGVLRVVGIVPLLGSLIATLAGLWMFVAMVVAVRHVLGYESTGRAVAVCLIGLVVPMAVMTFLAVIFGTMGAMFLSGS